MRIHQITSESTQSLEEGPLLNKIGSGIGKAVGAAAKGVGAVAGGVAGLGKAIKKGYQAGKATVGGADDEEGSETGATTTTPTTGGAAPAAPTLSTAPAAKAAPTTTPAAAAPTTTKAAPKSAFGKLSAAANGDEPEPAASKPAAATTAPAAPAADPKADTAYAQAQKAVTALAPEQRKEIVTMLQTDPKVKAAMAAKPAAGKVAAPASNTMANAPVSKTNKVKPGNPNAAPAVSSTKKPAMTKTGTVKQKQLTPAGFGQMVGGLTKQG